MLRIVIDLCAGLCAFAMVFHMKPFVTPFVVRFGLLASTLTVAAQVMVAISPFNVSGYLPDTGVAAVIFGFTLASRGRWERFVATEYLADPVAGQNDLHGRYFGAVALAVLIGLTLDWVVRL